MVIPVGKPGYQDFMVIDKDNDGKINKKKDHRSELCSFNIKKFTVAY